MVIFHRQEQLCYYREEKIKKLKNRRGEANYTQHTELNKRTQRIIITFIPIKQNPQNLIIPVKSIILQTTKLCNYNI